MSGTSPQKSITQRILDEMFDSIEEHEEFDEQVILKLKRLADSGILSKSERVIEVIKVVPGDEN